MSDETFALWLSRGLRWALGAGAILLATQYEDAAFLYVVGAVLIITGFFRPKRCTSTSCTTGIQGQGKQD